MIIQHERFNIIAGDLENAGSVSSRIKKVMLSMNITKALIKRVSIAMYEAEINVVIHSHGGQCYYSIHDNRIHIVFHDSGPGIANIEEAMKEGFSTASLDAISHGFGAGMGLANIKRVSDEFKLTSSYQGTVLDLIFYL